MTTPLLTLGELEALVSTGLGAADMQTILDREEAMLVRACGAHPDGATALTETHRPEGAHVYLRHGIVSVSSVEERSAGSSTWSTLDDDAYEMDEGAGMIERISGAWSSRVRVTYVPADRTSDRKAALIDLCRLAIERTAMLSENIAGEHSYTAPDWQAARVVIYQSVGFMQI